MEKQAQNIKTDYHMFIYLCRTARRLGCINDNILRPCLKYHFDLSNEETFVFYESWKKKYLDGLKETLDKPDAHNANY